MTKGQARKELLLKCGIEVMKIRGYNGTSVKDIVDAANVPKGSFYNYFESKKAFSIEAIETVAEENYATLNRILNDHSLSSLERIQKAFIASSEEALSNDFKIGCFLGSLCQEMSDNCEAIRLKIKSIFKEEARLFEMALVEAGLEGKLCYDHQPKELAEFLFNAWEGALMHMKATKSKDSLNTFIDVLPTFFNK